MRIYILFIPGATALRTAENAIYMESIAFEASQEHACFATEPLNIPNRATSGEPSSDSLVIA